MLKKINNTEDRDGLILMEEKVKKKIEFLELELNHWRECRKQLQWLMNPTHRETTIGQFISESGSQFQKRNEKWMGDVFGELFDEFFSHKVFGHTLQGMQKTNTNETEGDESA